MSKPRVPIFLETFDNKGVLGNYPSEESDKTELVFPIKVLKFQRVKAYDMF